MDAFSFIKLSSFILSSILSNKVGTDTIFKDGFDRTESEIFCPNAIIMTKTTNIEGGLLYRNDDVIAPAGDKDYFIFPALANQWYGIYGSGPVSNNDPDLIDSVISVYSADGSVLLAQNDDTIPFSSTDSEIYYHSTSNQNICVKVEDASTFYDSTPEGGKTYIYALIVLPLDYLAFDEFNNDIEPNNTTNTAQLGLSTVEYFNFQEKTTVTGTFADDTDEDFFQVTTPINSMGAIITAMPSGTNGHGSTATIDNLEIISGDGLNTVAQINPSLGVSEIFLPVQAETDYLIHSSSPSAPLGTNPFYTFKWQTLEGINPQETDNTANDSFSSSEIANPFVSASATRHFIGGTLDGVSDIDWWSFQASTGDEINLFCSSWYIGSGVRNATFSIYENPSIAALQSEVEVESLQINWSSQLSATSPEISVSNTTTHYISIEASSFSNTVSSRHYQCGIHVIHP